MTKMTKRDYFNQILSKYPLTADEKAFIDHELELLDRKNASGGAKVPTATQKANEGLKSEILDIMASDTRYTVSELDKMLGIGSPNKTNALVKQLKDAGLVIRTVEKGRAYFTKA